MEISGACKIDHLITGKQYGLQMLTGHCYNKKGERVVPCLLIYLSSGPWKALSNLSPLKTCFPEPLYLYPQTQPPPTFKLISPPIYHGVAIPFCNLPQPNALRQHWNVSPRLAPIKNMYEEPLVDPHNTYIYFVSASYSQVINRLLHSNTKTHIAVCLSECKYRNN